MAFAGYLAWKRVGVRIDWGLQAMEFDTFSGRWCFLDGFATKAGRGKSRTGKSASSATPWVRGLGFGGFGSVSPSLLLEHFESFCISLLFRSLAKFEFESSLCMLLRSHSFWFGLLA